ncbi:Pol I core factor CF, partial [Blyttiomyces sp. JEL0837]
MSQSTAPPDPSQSLSQSQSQPESKPTKNKRFCPICRSTKFHTDDAGNQFCKRGHQQSTAVEEVGDDTNVSGRARHLRKGRREKKVKERGYKVPDRELQCEIFQHLLKQHVDDAVEKIGFPEYFRENVFHLWLIYANEYLSTRRKIRRDKNNKIIEEGVSKIPVLLGDLVRLCNNGSLPYFTCMDRLPEELKECISAYNLGFARTQFVPRAGKLHETLRAIKAFYKKQDVVFPSLNVPLIVHRTVFALNLP